MLSTKIPVIKGIRIIRVRTPEESFSANKASTLESLSSKKLDPWQQAVQLQGPRKYQRLR